MIRGWKIGHNQKEFMILKMKCFSCIKNVCKVDIISLVWRLLLEKANQFIIAFGTCVSIRFYWFEPCIQWESLESNARQLTWETWVLYGPDTQLNYARFPTKYQFTNSDIFSDFFSVKIDWTRFIEWFHLQYPSIEMLLIHLWHFIW